MPKYTFRVTAVSPWFLNGADPRGQPELRAASVRGQLRYWLRAVIGAQSPNLESLWKAESAVFGSTGQSSRVTVRVYGKTPEFQSISILPHKSDPQERDRNRGNAIVCDSVSSLELVTRPGVELPVQALTALQVWSLLGGIGKRSRRMFGAVDVRPRVGEVSWYGAPSTPDDYGAVIRTLLQKIIVPGVFSGLPPFPTLHPEHSWILVGREVFDDPSEANAALFRKLLRTDRFRAHEQTFGQAVGGRRSSPLIAQVRKTTDGYIPILTVMRSKPDAKIKWNILCDFMDAASTEFSAVTAWGGRFA